MRHLYAGPHVGGDDGLWPMEGCEQLLFEGDLGSEARCESPMTGSPAPGAGEVWVVGGER